MLSFYNPNIPLANKHVKSEHIPKVFKFILRSYYLRFIGFSWASQVALVVKYSLANTGDVRDMVRSLGWEDPLEKGMATHSSILAWRIPWTEEPGRIQSIGSKSWTQLK